MKIRLFLLFSLFCFVLFFFSINVVCLNDVNKDTNTGNIPTISGPVKLLPWQDEEDFIMMCQHFNYYGPMAAYCTVLEDPLPGEEYNVHLAARLLCGKVIEVGQVFSQNQTIGPYNEANGFQKGPTYSGSQLITTIGGGVCKIASTLYNVSILSNLEIIERHAHSMPVPYVPYGQDATVAYGVKDFKFKNNTSFPIFIWAQGIDNKLFLAFYGKEKPPIIEWEHKTLKSIPSNKIYKYNPELPLGTENVLLEGMDGGIISSMINIEKHDGTIIRKNLPNSYYSPMQHLIEFNK